jgi:hypothetical protein
LKCEFAPGKNMRKKETVVGVKWPCGVCDTRVGSNSIVCGMCKKWVHERFTGVKGKLSTVVGFSCSRRRS